MSILMPKRCGQLALVVALALSGFATNASASAAAPGEAAPGGGQGSRVDSAEFGGVRKGPPPHAKFGIEILSNTRPEFVSGGDVLVRVTPPKSVKDERVTIRLNGADITGAFLQQSDGSFLGLVTGLADGANTLSAHGPGRPGGRSPGGPVGRSAEMKLTNYNVAGPVFSGPQQLPFFCQTTRFGLDPSVQPSCAAPTEVEYLYRSAAAGSREPLPLADPSAPPDDVAMTTVNGRQVPYVLRVERGTINRAVYEIAALYDGSEPDPLQPSDVLNGRMMYTFGGGCNAGFHQGSTTGGVVNQAELGSGYVVASSTLNVLNQNCNTVISAETAMMVKEHAIETYGPVEFTIGRGGSGGAIQQYQIADNYPGILDGILPSASFPDSVTLATVGDCRLMDNYVRTTENSLTAGQLPSVSGFRNYGSCRAWGAGFGTRFVADLACPAPIPEDRIYSKANPDGVKCTVAEQLVNQLGRDSETGFARGYYDNTAVQFGLEALQAGSISAEQFVALNEGIGGFDVAGNYAPERTAADPLAVERAYRSGLALNGGGGLAYTPVIDLRGYADPVANIHTSFWADVVRQRLQDANGSAANQVIFTEGGGSEALTKMEEWLSAIAADRTGADPRQVALSNKPADLADACWTPEGEKIVEPRTYPSSGKCGALYPAFGDTRTAAGAPLANDILACRLQPVDEFVFGDGVAFTPEQKARLRAVFPSGVCDYSRPGFGQQSPDGVWLDYSAGPLTAGR